MEVLSIIGILLGLLVLIVFALKGVPLYVLAPLAALVVAIFSGGNILTAMTDTYMTGFANFMKNFFLMFALSSIFAKIMGDSGAAKKIALVVARLVRKAPVKYQRFLAVLSVGIMTAILTVGGINLYCCIFVLVAVGKDLFEEFDIPWHLYMCSSLGSGSFTMSMIPGTPAIQNLIPPQTLGTTAAAAPVLGWISTVLCLALSVLYCWYALNRCDKRDEHFLPTGAKIKATTVEDAAGEEPKINIFLCLVPSIALLIALNGLHLDANVALVVAVVVALILFAPGLVKSHISIATCFGDGIRNAIMVLLNVCVIVGFGSVVSSTAGYTAIMNALDKVPGPPIFQLFIAVNIAAGVAGSASSALGIGLGMFAEKFLAMGISPDVIHRISVMASGGLDTLPHSSGTASALGVAQLSHKEGYLHVFWLNTVIPIVVTAIACVLASMGVC